MLQKTIRPRIITLIVLIFMGSGLGVLAAISSDQSQLNAGLIGAGVGCATALVAYMHLIFRTLFGRVPESQTKELAADSVERDVFRRAGERALPDIFSIVLGAALLAAFLPDGLLLRWTPVAVALGVVFVFAARAFTEWKQLVGKP
ncbi:hypothetical protein V5R04_04145 [Jonesiaceae bacterium BS-20]|uniref:Uncharacterized protein n=1 Tax=Jonesiaceae bacterium BS-20 TaxID=3120821 RepID=A0AAU7DY58_9MICO